MRTGVIAFLLLAFTAAGCTPPDTAPIPLDTQENGPPSHTWAVPTPQRTTAVARKPRDENKTEPPIPLDKWALGHANQTWGMKLKSVTYTDARHSNTGSPYYELLVELTKDLSSDEMKTVRQAFPVANQGFQSGVLMVCFFDKDMAVIDKHQAFGTTGEITGVKGDAFRLQVHTGAKDLKDAVRGEFRLMK
jgi:hypothetical protein